MNITVERERDCAALLHVEVPAPDVADERRHILQEFRRHARIPGFRPGKTPAAVLEKRFGPMITEELETRLARLALQEAAEKHHLRILRSRPPRDTAHHPDGTVSFTTPLTLAEFELTDYKGLVFEIPDFHVTEDDVRHELDEFRRRYADFTDITDRPVAMGDVAVLDYSTRIDGQPLEHTVGQSVGYLGGGEDYWLEMSEDALLPGFAAALLGARPGDQRSFSLQVPQDFPLESLRGSSLDFDASLKAVKQQVLPELDDALASKIVPGISLAELRDAVRDRLDQQLQKQLRDHKVNQLLERLNQSFSFDLPEELVTAETQGQADDLVEQGLGSGLSEDQLEAQQGEIFALAGRRARISLRTEFILQRIAEAENIEVPDPELAKHVATYAHASRRPVRAFTRELKTSGRLENLRHALRSSKTIDFLLEQSTFQTVTPPKTDDPAPES